MKAGLGDLRRILSAGGLYAAAAVAQRAVSFVLLPIYTRYIDVAEYGALELLNSFSSVLFGVLMLGLPSAITKCYHRDCETDEERQRVLATCFALELPALLVGGGLIALFAEPIGTWFLGRPGTADLVNLVVAAGVFSSLAALALAFFRAQERPLAYSTLTLVQFVTAMALNITFVVGFHMGVRGVLWGNLISHAVAFPLSLWVARQGSVAAVSRRLFQPLLIFGLLQIPVMLSTWVIGLSDRYVLSLYRSLEEVGIYGVGYKIGMVLQLVVVWPFQLGWPAFSFSISHQDDHKRTYALALTWFTAILAFSVIGLSLLARAALPAIVGEAYREAHRVVAPVALGYAFNGIQYCVAPGVHLAGKTKYLPIFSGIGAALNLGLNFLLIPSFGMFGAIWTTVISLAFVAMATVMIGQRHYPIDYELGRLTKIIMAAIVVYVVAVLGEPARSVWGAVAWHAGWTLLGFPALLLLLRVPSRQELETVRGLLHSLPFRKRGETP